MANAITQNDHSTGAGAFARLRQAIADRRRYRTTVEELSALDARLLADAGLTRGQIGAAARASVYGS
jgi:uncharacterized protein YjiS (DUF1127 family)